MLETTKVTRKGQVTIPASFRKKYNFREGVTVKVEETASGVLLEPIPDMNDWAGADAGKYTYEEITKRLDRLRERWR